MLVSLRCPVTAWILRLSILLDDKTVTVVALIEWLVKYGEIPALVVMFLSIFSRVLWPSLQAEYQTVHVAGLNLALKSRGFRRKHRSRDYGVVGMPS